MVYSRETRKTNNNVNKGITMTRSKWGTALAAVAALTVFAIPASAQDDDGGPMTQGDDAVYISVTHVKFKAGKRERAMEIIAEHFQPAGEAAGTAPPMMAIHYQTGKWDAAFIWTMEGGMADMEWYRTEDDIKWFEALSEQLGGAEAAEALLAEWTSGIAGSVTEVGHYHTGMTDE